jgi:hypothetical protein
MEMENSISSDQGTKEERSREIAQEDASHPENTKLNGAQVLKVFTPYFTSHAIF